MRDDILVKAGAIGATIAAVCCFTPLLVVVLAAVGLSALIGWLDVILLPVLAISIAVVAYGLVRRRRHG